MSDARPNEIVSAVRKTIENSNNLPSQTSYLEHEPDLQGEDAGLHLPLVTVRPISNLRIRNFNTDRVGYTYDAQGNQTGRVFEAEYRLNLRINIWTAAQSSGPDVRELGEKVWDALYPHDTAGPDQPLPDMQDFDPDAVFRLTVRQGEAANDMTMTPSLRRWRMSVWAWATHEFTTTESYVTGVTIPGDGDFSDLDDDGMISSKDDSQDSDW